MISSLILLGITEENYFREDRGMTMKWNVYYHDINRRKMTTFNIFNHYGFRRAVKEAIKKYRKKDEFIEQLRKELMYFFWSKSEYEIVITPWVGGDREKEAEKIDIYEQIMMNYDIFSEYVWKNRKKLLIEE